MSSSWLLAPGSSWLLLLPYKTSAPGGKARPVSAGLLLLENQEGSSAKGPKRPQSARR